MITEELGTLIEEWKKQNFEYVTREQSKKFRDEFENKTDNQDILAILKKIKEHMDNNGWEYTPVSEVKTTEELVEDTVTTEDTPEDTDSAGDSTTSTKTVKLTRKELSLAKKELRIKEFATLSLTEKCNADVEYDKILKQIKQIKDNLDKYNTRFIDFKKKKANKIATLEKKLEKIEDMIMLGKK